MKLTVVAWLGAALLSAGGVDAQSRSPAPPPEIPAADAKKHVGEEVTICGPVVTYECSPKNGTLLLDLISPYWVNGVSIAIAREHWSDFGGNGIVHRFLAASVCVTGTVERARKRFRISVRQPDQLRVTQPSAVVAPQHATALLSCQEDVKAPELIKEVKPNYTQAAMLKRQEGLIFLDPIVLADGSVGEVRVVYGISPDYGLNQQAIDAVKQWRFRPGTLDGRAVPVVVSVEMSFTRW